MTSPDELLRALADGLAAGRVPLAVVIAGDAAVASAWAEARDDSGMYRLTRELDLGPREPAPPWWSECCTGCWDERVFDADDKPEPCAKCCRAIRRAVPALPPLAELVAACARREARDAG